MILCEVEDYEQMSRKAASIIAAQIVMEPETVLGLATGSTPQGTYRQLVKWYQQGDLDFSKVSSVNLDEYKGLSGDDRQSYRNFMNENLFDYINVAKSRTFIPDGTEPDSEKACRDYDEVLRRLGRTDLQILGIGANGHIGFNEPGETFVSKTHCVELARSTVKANARFFGQEERVPVRAYTMGIGDIMKARKILLLASGESKADALYQSLYGPVTPRMPASILQFHWDVTVIADRRALAVVRERCYNPG